MKRSLAILLCLLIIGSAAAGGFSLSHIDSADELEFTEDIIYGDPKELEGLNVRFTSSVSRFLDYYPRLGSFYWTTEACFDEGRIIAETKQEYSYKKPSFSIPETVFVRTDPVYSGASRLIYPGLIEKIREGHSEELEEGKAVSIEMPLKDIFMQYPIEITLQSKFSRSAFEGSSADRVQNAAVFQKKADEYFKFPIAEDITASLIMTKTGITRIENLSGNNFEKGMEIRKFGSFSTGDKLYFFFEAQVPGVLKGTRYDYSMVPGGYGVYSVSIHYDDNVLIADVDSLSTLCSFGDETSIEALSSSKDGSVIYVFAGEKDEHVVYAIDSKTGKTMQKLSICSFEPREIFVQKEEGYLLFGAKIGQIADEVKGAVYVLEEGEGGLLDIALKADINSVASGHNIYEILQEGKWLNVDYRGGYEYLNGAGICNAYKDGKLYIVSPDLSSNAAKPEYSSRCGVAVAVFGKEGPLFFGNYKSSIGGTSCEPQRYIRPEISFE